MVLVADTLHPVPGSVLHNFEIPNYVLAGLNDRRERCWSAIWYLGGILSIANHVIISKYWICSSPSKK